MRFSGGNRLPQTFSAHFLRKSAATNFFSSFPQEIGRHKLFRLISSGNRPPQNFFGSFPQEIGRHKLFRLISSGNRLPQNFFGSFPQEIVGWPTSNSRYSYVKRTLYRLKQPLHSPSLAIDRQNGITPPGRSVEKLRH